MAAYGLICQQLLPNAAWLRKHTGWQQEWKSESEWQTKPEQLGQGRS